MTDVYVDRDVLEKVMRTTEPLRKPQPGQAPLPGQLPDWVGLADSRLVFCHLELERVTAALVAERDALVKERDALLERLGAKPLGELLNDTVELCRLRQQVEGLEAENHLLRAEASGVALQQPEEDCRCIWNDDVDERGHDAGCEALVIAGFALLFALMALCTWLLPR